LILIQGKEKLDLPHNPVITNSILAFGFLALISIVFVSYNSESILELNRVLFFILSYLFFLSQAGRAIPFILVFVLLGFVYMVYGYIDYFKYYNTQDLHRGLYDMRAAIGHKNLMSMFLVLTFPWLLYLANSFKFRGIHYFLFSYFVLAAALIVLCQSRVGMLALFIFLFLTVVFLIRRYQFNPIKIVVISIVLFASIHLIFKSDTNYQRIVKRGLSIVNINKDLDENSRSVYERKTLWKKTWEIFQDYPIMGCGLGQWKLHIVGYDINETRSKFGNIIFQQPHNDYLWVSAEYGILGVILFILILFTPLVILVRLKERSILDYSLAMFFILYTVVSMFDFPKERPQFLFVLASTLALVSKRSGSRFYAFPKVIFLVLAIYLLSFFAKRILAESQLAQLQFYRENNKFDQVSSLASRIANLGVEYDQTSTPIDFYLGEASFYKGNYSEAKAHFLKSIERSPYHLYSWNNIGAVYLKLGIDLKAIYSWEKAKDLSRDFTEPRLNLAQYYLNKNDPEEAEKQLHFLLERDDVVRYQAAWNNILDSLVIKTNFDTTSEVIQNRIKDFKADQRRKNWFIQVFCRDSLPFKQQLLLDISYATKQKKN
jgi:O-antigen ligase